MAQKNNEQKVATDNQQEAALQVYFDKISQLILEEHLNELKPEYEAARKIARVRTLTALLRLDKSRKRSVLQFLFEAGLIDKDLPVIELAGADLREVDMGGFNLRGANLVDVNLSRAKLRGANLIDANLSKTDLQGAILSGAKLAEAKLSKANLYEADLRGADLRGAWLLEAKLNGADLRGTQLYTADLGFSDLSGSDLSKALVTSNILVEPKSLRGATMPDGSKHP